MATIKCIHCRTDNDGDATTGHCQSCGEELPIATTFVVGEDDNPFSDAASGVEKEDNVWTTTKYTDERRVRDEDDARRAKQNAALMLFIVAFLQCLCGATVFVLLMMAPERPHAAGRDFAKLSETVTLVMGGIGIAFAVLGAWALFHPLPATIVALMLYLGLACLDLVAAPNAVFALCAKIPVLLVIVQGVRFASRYNVLQTRLTTRP
jgi:hypothetical protein